jgi:hypothetical protein
LIVIYHLKVRVKVEFWFSGFEAFKNLARDVPALDPAIGSRANNARQTSDFGSPSKVFDQLR